MLGYKIYDKKEKMWKMTSYWTVNIDKAKVYRSIGLARSAIGAPWNCGDEIAYMSRFELVEFEMIERKRVSYFDSYSEKDLLLKIKNGAFTPVQIVALKKQGYLKKLEHNEN